MKGDLRTKRLMNCAVYMLAAVVSCLLLVYAKSRSVVLDEAFSIRVAQGGWNALLETAKSDDHPPLYYTLLWISRHIFGDSIVVYRITTIIPNIINVFVVGAFFLRKKSGYLSAIFYILLFGLSSGTLTYNAYIRMYSWGCLFVSLIVPAMYMLCETEKKRYLVGLIVFTILGIYTHNFCLIAAFSCWLIGFAYILVKKRKLLIPITVSGFGVVISYLPWLLTLFKQTSRVTAYGFLDDYTLKDWVLSADSLLANSLVGMNHAIYILFIVAMLYSLTKRNSKAIYAFSIYLLFMVIISVISSSFIPIWATRFSYVVWGCLCMAVALAYGDGDFANENVTPFSKRNVGQLCLVFLLILMGVFSQREKMDSDLIVNDAKEFEKFCEEHVDDIVAIDDVSEHRIVYEYYMDRKNVAMLYDVTHGGLDWDYVNSKVSEDKSKKHYVIINDIQKEIGLERLMENLSPQHSIVEHVGTYVIQYKRLNIYEIKGEMSN